MSFPQCGVDDKDACLIHIYQAMLEPRVYVFCRIKGQLNGTTEASLSGDYPPEQMEKVVDIEVQLVMGLIRVGDGKGKECEDYRIPIEERGGWWPLTLNA
ncbi:hypothetical protein L1987_54139 [Smallanthus sonchifolius]|uniref:Uncharacterized protein n=1 Tax=Smallanthus sonchifolius TaxID=185202 RepID=A0ACB9E6E5_9ASTR|nr:hypothetical protein L1987_54139 [Smallanthus sonchifolius]